MLAFIISRILQALPVMAVVALISFAMFAYVGDPVAIMLGQDFTEAQRQALVASLGLDQPFFVQFGKFIWNALHGEFGLSYRLSRPVAELIEERAPATLELAFGATILAILVGLPLGLYAGLRPNGAGAKAIMASSILGFSLPTFWVGLMLIMVFAVQLGWLPSTGRGETAEFLGMRWSFLTWDGLRHMAMPALNLALFKISLVIRLTRAGVRETMLMDYVKFARAKGLSPRRVIGVHVFKNILIPVVTVVGLELGSTIAFSVVTESVFAWPGMGKLIIDSINVLDRPVIVAYLMSIVLMFIIINLVVDLLYSVLDPRVRLESKG